MNEFLDVNEVSKILGKSVSTILSETSKRPENLPPFAKIGGAIRFDRDKIQPWFDSKIVNPLPTHDAPPIAKKTGRPAKGGLK